MSKSLPVAPAAKTGLFVAAMAMGPAPKVDPKKTDDPVELVNQINKAWEDFKTANDQALEDHRAESQETVNKIEASITDMQGRLEESLAKQAKELAGLKLRGGDVVDKDMSAHARAFALQTTVAQKGGREAIAAVLDAEPDVEALEKYTKAFNQLMAHGVNANAIRTDVRDELSIGFDNEGGYLVPPQQAKEFVTRLFDTSPVRQVANVIQVLGDKYEYPLDTNEGISGGWVTEKGSRSATGTPQVGMGEIRAHEQYAFPQITQQALEDQMLINPQNWLEAKTADKMVRDENAAFVNGNGVGKPKGFLAHNTTAQQDKDRAWGKLQHILTGADGAFPTAAETGDNPDAIIDTIYALKQQYRQGAVWAMNRFTEAKFRKLKDADGNYRWTPAQTPGQPAMLENYPVWNFEDMPDLAADSLSAAFGNFKEGYTIIDRVGLSVLVDPYTNKPFVGFYIRKRVGGDVVNFDAIKLMKFGD